MPPPSRTALYRRRYRSRWLRGGFRTVELNAVGWSALVGAGLVAGVVVAVGARVRPAFALPAGVLASWVACLAADRRCRRRSTVHLVREMDRTTGEAIVAELRATGVEANYVEHAYDSEDGTVVEQRAIACRQADRDAVEAVLDRRLGRGHRVGGA